MPYTGKNNGPKKRKAESESHRFKRNLNSFSRKLDKDATAELKVFVHDDVTNLGIAKYYRVTIQHADNPPETRLVNEGEANEWRKHQTDEYFDTTGAGSEVLPQKVTRPLHDRVLVPRTDANRSHKSDTGDKPTEVLDDKEKKEQFVLNEAAKLTPYKGDRKVEIIKPPYKQVGIDEELTDFEKRVVWKLRQTELSQTDKTAIERSIADIVHAVIKDNGQRLILLKAPLLWKNRSDKNQQPHEFIQETYIDAGHDVNRSTLRKLDATLIKLLEKQERDPNRSPPQEFLDRFPRKQDALDAQIAHVKETGERPTSWREQHRLRQAARRRGTDLNKE